METLSFPTNTIRLRSFVLIAPLLLPRTVQSLPENSGQEQEQEQRQQDRAPWFVWPILCLGVSAAARRHVLHACMQSLAHIDTRLRPPVPPSVPSMIFGPHALLGMDRSLPCRSARSHPPASCSARCPTSLRSSSRHGGCSSRPSSSPRAPWCANKPFR